MPLRNIPRQQLGITSQAASLPSDARARILESILQAAEGGVQAYHIGTRGLQRYSLKDRLDLWAALGASDSAITGQAIAVRRGVPTDM